MKQEHLQLFEILLWNHEHHFKDSWTKFCQNVQYKKKFVAVLEITLREFQMETLPNNYFQLMVASKLHTSIKHLNLLEFQMIIIIY